jgi:hypothetical protein
LIASPPQETKAANFFQPTIKSTEPLLIGLAVASLRNDYKAAPSL